VRDGKWERRESGQVGNLIRSALVSAAFAKRRNT